MRISEVIAAVVAALQLNHGGALDLSGEDRVKRGRYAAPPVAPAFACVSGPGVTSEEGPVLVEFTRTIVLEIRAWIPVARMDLETRVEAADEALDLLIGALDTARRSRLSVLYRLRRFVVRAGSMDADTDPHPPGAALVILEVELSYATSTGLST